MVPIRPHLCPDRFSEFCLWDYSKPHLALAGWTTSLKVSQGLGTRGGTVRITSRLLMVSVCLVYMIT